ncbi:C-type lectin domain family 12 member B-like isoform X2 [Podarcis raffonei]|uniref:C-type lectin domain family 12 member B-like isoform X2 n=1 Tax=Podarcis raffonei TaxID=65483 RepID=UPI0023291C89|nr:C-type lectin domain family 12 member B-like isoform X2 [Podarcis raffonei]
MDRSPVFGGPPAPRAAERVPRLPPTGSGMTTSQGIYTLAKPAKPPLPPKPVERGRAVPGPVSRCSGEIDEENQIELESWKDGSTVDSPNSFDDDDDYDDGGVVTAMTPASQTTPLADRRGMDAKKAPANAESPQRKDSRRIHVFILYVLVAICFVMLSALLVLVLVKYSGLSEEIQALHLNKSEMLLRVKKDLDDVQAAQKIMERTISNNFSELQDVTEFICSSRNYSHPCPKDWKTKEKNCYYISEETKNWTDALWQCIYNRAYLVSIWSDDEQGFLRDNIHSASTYWLGAAYNEKEGKWRWKEGHLLISTAFWDIGQPQMGAEKECGVMHPNGTWASAVCSLPYRWICKRRLFC